MAAGWNQLWRVVYFGGGTVLLTPLLLMLVNAIVGTKVPVLFSIVNLSVPHGLVAAVLSFVALDQLVKRWTPLKRLA